MEYSVSLSDALEGYFLYADARRLSPHTVADYANTFRRLQDFLGEDPPMDSITPGQIRSFLAARSHLSKKTLLNYHVGLSALWTWAMEEGLVSEHILKRVDRPRPEQKVIKPYTKEDIQALLAACDYSSPYSRPGKRECRNRRPTALRDRAIILVHLGVNRSIVT